MNSRRWIIQKTDDEICSTLRKELGVFPVTAKLLNIRGLNTPDMARDFLFNNIDIHDPFLLKDMDKAVQRLHKAIENNEKICIYGDYDVDGVTATTILYTYLKNKNVDCCYYIPERVSEGYGLNIQTIDRLVNEDINLLITVDTGITANDEVEYVKSKGIDLIITDHHSCRDEIPKATAVINPQREDCDYPFKHLAGVGVVFKLLCAMEKDNQQAIFDDYAEMVAIGTIADVMPLIDENRKISIIGLANLQNTRYPGLRALMKETGLIKNGITKKIGSTAIGYVLAPRLNAAGRIDTASKAVELLLSETEEKAGEIAALLCDMNKVRQETEYTIYKQAQEMIASRKEEQKVIVLESEEWHQGVIGIVASRISERYNLPCILISVSDGVGKGSGRSIQGFSIMDALNNSGDLLVEYGGHELAAGLTIDKDKIEEFRARINQYADANLSSEDTIVSTDIDCEVDFNEIHMDSILEILTLEPFGLENPVPLFYMRNVMVTDVFYMSGNKHIRVRLKPADSYADTAELVGVYFGIPTGLRVFVGDIYDVFFSVDINEYRGIRQPQLMIKAIKQSDSIKQTLAKDYSYYKKICDKDNKEPLPAGMIPNLNDFRIFFVSLKRELKGSQKGKSISITHLHKYIKQRENYEINTCKIRIILDVLSQEKLISLTQGDSEESFAIELLPVRGKVNLDNNPFLIQIKQKHSIMSGEHYIDDID